MNHFTLVECLENRIDSQIKRQVIEISERLIKSGAINLDDYLDNIELSDILVTAALNEIANFRIMSSIKKTKKELNNLAFF